MTFYNSQDQDNITLAMHVTNHCSLYTLDLLTLLSSESELFFQTLLADVDCAVHGYSFCSLSST